MNSTLWQVSQHALRMTAVVPWAAFCAVLATSLCAVPAAAQSVWELTPYRIHVTVAFAPAVELTPRVRAELLAGLIHRTDALIGPPWEVAAAPAPRTLRRAMLAAIGDFRMQSLPAEATDGRKRHPPAGGPVEHDEPIDANRLAIAEYLGSLIPKRPPSPPEDLRSAIEDGRRLFFHEETGCSGCHQLPLYTDDGAWTADGLFARHDVGTLSPSQSGRPQRLDTPSLFGLRRSAPYLHDGRAETLEEVLTEFNPQDGHGRTSQLSEEELQGLVQFLWHLEPPAYDKVILLAIEPSMAGYRITARELDVRTRLFGTPVATSALQLGKLGDVAFDAVRGAFVPLARIESVEDKHVTLRLKAAGLPFRDNELAMVGPGQVFRPIIRYNDREGNAARIVAVPWTCCTVQESAAKPVATGRVRCKLYTGLRSPLSGRRRGRIEQLALGVVPPHEPSVLVLQSRSTPCEALAGYEVYAHPPDSKTTTLLGRTDYRGRVPVLPAKDILRVLLVRNGGETLARLPMVPGIEPEVVASISNDDQRLKAEGYVTGLQEELVDLVTRRQILITLARARIDAGELDQAKQLIDELDRLPKRLEFNHRLGERQKSLRSSDSRVQARIDALFSDTRRLLEQHLGPEPIEEVWQKFRKARGEAGH
ncbi:MAG: hypothetical protein JXB62_00380 [Pirellulales bacterium]|nr:hypothetical protein [Pirellulales bacterium]